VPAATPGCALLAVLLSLALTGCSGSRFGETLSRSFSGTPARPAGGALGSGAGAAAPTPSSGPSTAAGGATPGASGANPGKAQAAGSDPSVAKGPGTTQGQPAANGKTAPQGKAGATASTAGPAATSTPGSGSPAAAPLPGRPAPYRVTILLPQADASAPAEVVTQALRAAGVPFEVETIERIGSGSSQASQGAANPSAQTAPSVRPAPPPR